MFGATKTIKIRPDSSNQSRKMAKRPERFFQDIVILPFIPKVIQTKPISRYQVNSLAGYFGFDKT